LLNNLFKRLINLLPQINRIIHFISLLLVINIVEG